MFSHRRNLNNSGQGRADLLRSRKAKATGNRWSKAEAETRPAPARRDRSAGGAAAASGPRDWSRARLVLVGVVFLLIWTGLWARAWFLQIHEGETLAVMAERQHVASETVTGRRGEILDRNGKILARSVEVSSVYAVPKEITDPEATATVLSKVLGVSRNQVARQLQSGKNFVWVARKVSDAAAEEIRGLKLKGVHLEAEYERAYPYKQLAGQLLGFVGIDDKGLEGLERSFDDILSGRRGQLTMQRDAAGRRLYLEGLGQEEGLMGQDIRLTLDAQIQYFAEDALAKTVVQFGGKWGGCLVVDVPTGEILAWAEYPFFNPNAYREYQPSMWRSRLAMDALEQGSTVKPLLVAAALSEGVIKPDQVFYCEKGVWKYNKTTIRDTHSYGDLPLTKVLSYSSNIGAAKIGLLLGTKNYHNYLDHLGFGNKTGLPIPGEAVGILRAPKQWSETDLINASFGQSFSATGLQMAQAYLTLAAGGERRPLKLVLSDMDAQTLQSRGYAAADGDDEAALAAEEAAGNGWEKLDEADAADSEEKGDAESGVAVNVESDAREQVFKRQSAEVVLSMLREVVEEGGTGQRARISIPGLVVGGKTGTAQKASGKSYGSARVASFVGIAPLQNPRYLVLVMVDEPRKAVYGGVVAAPVFRKIITHTLAYRGELPEEKLDLAENEQDKLEAVKEAALDAVAKDAARGKEKTGNGKEPQKQAASGKDKAAAEVKNNGQAKNDGVGKETVAAKPGVVPNVVGKSVRRAMEAFMSQGVMPVVKGEGQTVTRQEPKPGAPLSANSKTEYVLWLSDDQQ